MTWLINLEAAVKWLQDYSTALIVASVIGKIDVQPSTVNIKS
jgi:hypothetical protein